MTRSSEPAGEHIGVGSICVARADGKLYRYRGAPAEAVLGVATSDADIGEPIRFLADIDAISESLMSNLTIRA